ncbi:MAG: hypothetical protein QF805_31505, partial [Pirellulaceae bacterium]|nr:hypothetical protein [Pirellulaceae bacterium]
EGYPAMWPSNIIKRASVVFPKWWDAGIDPMDVMIKQTQKVGREVFVTFRMAGADVEGDDEFTDHRQSRWNEEGP